MSAPKFNAATHISIVWGVMLAFLTLLEWNSLDRDPMRKQILSPFIERDIAVSVIEGQQGGDAVQDPREADLRYEVTFDFNGPLFMVVFFTPVLVVHVLARLIARARGSGAKPDGSGLPRG